MAIPASAFASGIQEILDAEEARDIANIIAENPNIVISPGGEIIDSETGEVADIDPDLVQGVIDTGEVPIQQIGVDPVTPGTAGPISPAASIGNVLAQAGGTLNTLEEINALEGAIVAQAALNVQTAFAQPFVQFDKSAVADLTEDQLAAQGLTRAAATRIAELGGAGAAALGQLFAGTEASRKAETAFTQLAGGDQALAQAQQTAQGLLGTAPQATQVAQQQLQQQAAGIPGAADIQQQLAAGPQPTAGGVAAEAALTAGLTPQETQGIQAAQQVLEQQGLSPEQASASARLQVLGEQRAAGVEQAQQALSGLLGPQAGIQEAAFAAAAPILRELRQDILPGISAGAIQQGAFGGSRQQLLEQEAALQFGQRAAETAATVGLQATQAQNQQVIQAAQQLANLGLSEQEIQANITAQFGDIGQQAFQNILQAGGLGGGQQIQQAGQVQQAAGTLQTGAIAEQGLVQQGLQAAGQLGVSEAEVQQRAAALAGELGISIQDAQLRVIEQVTQTGVAQAGVQEAGAQGLLGVEAGQQAGVQAGIAGLPTVSQTLQTPGGLLQQVGGQLQDVEQARLTEEERRFIEQQNFQRATAIQSAAAASSLAGGSGFIQANVQPVAQQAQEPSLLERGLGLAATATGIAGGLGLLD